MLRKLKSFVAKHPYVADLSERVFWTGVQAGLGLVTVETLNVPLQYAAVVAAVLAVLKAAVAKRLGDPDTASTLPTIDEPVEG